MRRLVCLFLLLLFADTIYAQLPKKPDGVKQPRILILMDGSSSMLSMWDEKMPRFKAAGEIVTGLIDSVYEVNNQVEFGLRVYGHQYPAQENNCTDTRREVMFSKDNYAQMSLRIASLHPSGVSPMAYALKEAANNDMEDEQQNAYSIILITDGGESCNGNVCDVVENLIKRKIFFKSYVISLVNNEADHYKYQCLGDNIIVTTRQHITDAIQHIMADYRPMLQKPIMIVSKPIEPKPQQPDIRTIAIPKTLFDKSEIKVLPVVLKDNIPQTTLRAPVLRRQNRPFLPIAKIEKEAPEPIQLPSTSDIRPLSPVQKSRIPQTITRSQVLRRQNRPFLATTKVEKEAPEPIVLQEVPNIKALPIVQKARMPQMYHYNPVLRKLNRPIMAMAKIEKEAPELVAVSPLFNAPERNRPIASENHKAPVAKPATQPEKITLPKKDTSNTSVTLTQKPAKDTMKTTVTIKPLPPVVSSAKADPAKTDNKSRSIPFTASSEDANTTTAQIYFTDGHGKFYKTTPKLQLINADGFAIKSFYRTVDANGNPDPIELPTGRYSISIPGRSKAIMTNITITPNKKHKFVAVVTNGSLTFRYDGAKDRPVSEFEAIVNILFEPGPTVKQRCTAELEYAPGNYHVEVNTLPITKFNVDIDFGSTSELPLKQPGFVQFTNQYAVGKISLYYQLGDQFVRFHIMDLNGNLEAQKLRLQPGPYEVHWVKNPAAPFGTETVQRFQVKSNSATEIELH